MILFSTKFTIAFLLVFCGVALCSDHQAQVKAITTKPTHGAVHSSESKVTEVSIYKGNATTMNTHRYLVVIKKNGTFHCTGGIVSVNWVLTTGDCTTGATASELTVVTSSRDGETGKTFAVMQIVEHPDYGSSTLDYEYSCVRVEGTFYYWEKRSHFLPTAQPQDYTTLTVAGYGYTSASSTTHELRKAVMTWLPQSYCKKVYKDYDFTWSNRMACVYSPDKATLCGGDYGDSFVVGRVVYGQFTGVAKSGFCSDKAKPVVISNIFTASEWIQNITGARVA